MSDELKKNVGNGDESTDDIYSSGEPAVFAEPAVRPLPKDESLFEFDGFVEDDTPLPEKPELTEAEAKYANELSEKYGIVKDIGVGFISDEEMEQDQEREELEKAERAKAFAEKVSAEKSVFEDSDTADAPAAQTEQSAIEEQRVTVQSEPPVCSEQVSDSENVTETVNIEEHTPDIDEQLRSAPECFLQTSYLSEKTKLAQETSELSAEVDASAYEKTSDSEKTTAEEQSDPAQITFDGILEHELTERKREEIPKITPGGVQITFLDVAELQSSDERERSDTDAESSKSVSEPPIQQEYELITEERFAPISEQTVVSQAQMSVEVQKEPEVHTESSTEAEISKAPDAQTAKSPETETQKAPETVTLTPIEISAMEEEQRLRQEEEAAKAKEIEVREFESDIWDAEDKELWVAKKRYMDYCAELVVPPLKITKEEDTSKKTESDKRESSGYRYEMTERAPIFEDGIGAGKNSDSYFKREMEYCEKREVERGAQYRDRLRLSWKKTVFSFAIMLTVILIENIGIFFKCRPDDLISATNPTVFSLVVLALLAIGGGLIFDALRDGVKLALKGVFVPETLTACVLAEAIIYHSVIAFVTVEKAMLFGTSAAVSVFLTALYRYLMLKREYTVFTVTSSFGEYVTDVRMQGFGNTPEGKAFDGYADPQSALYKLNKVSRIDGAYNDDPVRDECYGLVRIIFLCTLCAAVVAGTVFGLINRDAFSGVKSAMMMLSFAAPVSVFVALGVPRLRAANASAEMGGAIVDFDDESDEFDQSVIMLDDCDLFPAKKLVSSGFDMRHTDGLELSLSRTISLFRKIGGPLKALYVEGGNDGSENVIITEISEHGISAKIDGRDICAGNDVYMQSKGIKIKRHDKLLPKNSRVMYIADDGVFFAKSILTFNPDKELVRKIAELRNTDTLFSLKTCNPCIDRELLFYTTGLEPDLVRLVKYAPGDEVAPAETDREGSLVSAGGTKGFITALLEYKRQKKLVYNASRFMCVACVIGAAVAALSAATGIGAGFSSLVALGLHASLSIAAFILSGRKAINTKSKIQK